MATAAISERLPSHHHFEWITDYLAARRLTGRVRWMMASISASLALCVLALLLSVDGPRSGTAVAMMWTAFGGGVVGALLWLRRWPSHAQSLLFALLANASIALACLAYPNPQGALTGCIAFATTAAYVAFFHSTSLVAYNVAVAAAVAVIAAVRVASSGHLALAAVDLFLVVQVNIAMPLGIYVLIRALGVDLERADRDPLTGLLNRRSFEHHVEKMVSGGGTAPDAHLVVAVVDLDDFKRINDTRGHRAGDDALVAVGRALTHAVSDVAAVVVRSGGEEFIVAVTSSTGEAPPLARRLCDGISALPLSITASVGTAAAHVPSLRELDFRANLAALVVAADEAMYQAKRAGGNGHRHAGCGHF